MFDFYPRDAMLARVLAVPCVRLSVSVSVTSRSLAKRLNESSSFWHENVFHLSYTVFVGNLVIFKNKGTSFWNKTQDVDIFFGISIVETSYRLSSTNTDARNVMNWIVVGQLSR